MYMCKYNTKIQMQREETKVNAHKNSFTYIYISF